MAKRNSRERAKANADKRKKMLKSVFTSGAIGKAVEHAVGLSEAIGGAGPVKHKRVVGILNTLVDIPALNEATEAWIFDHAIKAALKVLNPKKAAKE